MKPTYNPNNKPEYTVRRENGNRNMGTFSRTSRFGSNFNLEDTRRDSNNKRERSNSSKIGKVNKKSERIGSGLDRYNKNGRTTGFKTTGSVLKSFPGQRAPKNQFKRYLDNS